MVNINHSNALSKKERVQFVLEHIQERKKMKSRKSIKINKKGMKFSKGGNFVEEAIHSEKRMSSLKEELEKDEALLSSSFLYIKLGLRWNN